MLTRPLPLHKPDQPRDFTAEGGSDETVVINLVGLDFYDLTLSQSLVKDCVANEV